MTIKIHALSSLGVGLAWLLSGGFTQVSLAQETAVAEVQAKASPQVQVAIEDKDAAFTANRTVSKMRSLTNAERKAAAQRAAERRKKLGIVTLRAPVTTQPLRRGSSPLSFGTQTGSNGCSATYGVPCGSMDFFGTIPNYAMSKFPASGTTSVQAGVGIRKFVDTLAGLGPANHSTLNNNFIPVAVPFATKPTGVPDDGDYYEIGLLDYTTQFNSDLPNTTQVRGYADLNPSAADNNAHYLGPMIIAQSNRPVRVRFKNQLSPTSKLFMPVDRTIMGAGLGPDGQNYSTNRANMHLHGGNTPWISDGTPHQWTVPIGDTTSSIKKGVSAVDVPDMPASGDGQMTFFYTNQQSGRLLWYHDHSYGITRLNVYAGEAAGYLIHDASEQDLIDGTNTTGVNSALKTVIPNNAGVDQTTGATGGGLYKWGIPLIFQDKTFVPPPTQLTAQDPTWNWGAEGNLWFPHVYMTNQSPSNPDNSGVNAMGRWDLGAWFWPPMTASTVAHAPIPCGTGASILTTGYPSGSLCPPNPNPSLVPEAFMDTPVVNGIAYPTLTLPQGVYRFRMLNAANDRFFNFSLFYAADKDGNVCKSGYPNPNSLGTTNVVPSSFSSCTEVKMVDAIPHRATTNANDHLAQCSSDTLTNGAAGGSGGTNGCYPASWPTDGRDGGVPDPSTAGPAFIQIGTEAGVLPAPVVIDPTPIGYNYNRRDVVVLNVANKALFVGPAERADVIVDLSQVPAGSTLMLYNDSPAPVPGFDSRLDTYTGDPDQTDIGGAPTTLPGYGPNIRTVMQIHITSGSTTAYNLSDLQTALPVLFAATQPAIIVPEKTYSAAAIGGTPDKNTYSRIGDTSITFTPIGGSSTTKPLGSNAIHELFEADYGRMNSILGVELPLTSYSTQTTIPLAYVDPPTEVLKDGEVQLWKVTHNGVDSHAIHFHLVNVQLINRIGWDGAIRPPDPNELGWKETVRMNPLEDAVVAMKPVKMTLPSSFPIGDSVRLLDPTRAENATNAAGMPGFTNIDPLTNNPTTTYNTSYNFGWEYVWHCHLLGHEESDMMRPLVFDVNSPPTPSNLTGAIVSGGNQLNWQFTNVSGANAATNLKVQRAPLNGAFTDLTGATALSTSTTTYTDTTATGTFSYRVVSYNSTGLSGPSNTVTLLRLAAPTNLTAPPASVAATSLILNWTAPSPNTGVTGYAIQRSADGTTGWTTVGTSISTSFRSTGLTTKTTYYYRVQATGNGGATSAFTSALSVTTK